MASTLGIGPIDVLMETQRMRERQQDRQPDLLNTLLQGIETGAKLENFPDQLRQQRLAQQLAVELQQANIEKMRRPEWAEVGGGLYERDPTSPTGFRVLVTPPVKAEKSPFSPQQITSLTDPNDVRFAFPDEGGRPPKGYQFTKAIEQPIKPAEKLQALKFVRDIYEDSPTKVSYFGKGQLPGSDEIKTRLDAVLKPVGGDFSKLNAQAKDSFLFAMNNLRDPRSATLLNEANQIAERMGLGDRFNTYVQGLKTGERVSTQVAKEIYDVISQTHALQEERLIDDLIQRKDQLNILGSDLKDIGVPKLLIDKVSARIANPQAASSIIPTIPGTTAASPTAVPTAPGRTFSPAAQEFYRKQGRTP